MFIVYKTTNLLTGQFYVGMHRMTSDLDDYLGSGVGLKKNVAEYGKENFSRITLRNFQTEIEARMFETETIELCIDDELCLNISRQSVGGYFNGCSHTPETIAKISSASQKQAALHKANRIQSFCQTCEIELWSKPSRVKKFCSLSCAGKKTFGVISDAEVKKLYLEDNYSAQQIADSYNCSLSTVRKRISSLEILKKKARMGNG